MPEHVLVYLPSDLTFTDDALAKFKGYGSRNFIYKDNKKGLYCNHFAVYDSLVTSNNVTTGSYDYYVPTPFHTDSISYNRKFLSGYNTTYLPYSTALPSGVTTVYTFTKRSDSKQDFNSKYAYEFTAMTTLPDSLEANKAYLLYSSSNYTMPNRVVNSEGKLFGSTTLLTVPKTPDFNSYTVTKNKDVQFIGTTEDIPNDSAVVYNGFNLAYNGTTPEWRMVTTDNTSGYFDRFRGFICDNKTTSSAKQTVVSMVFHNADGSTTEIEGITLNDLTSGDKRIYTLDGKFIGTDIRQLPAGIYIKNGKKFLKK